MKEKILKNGAGITLVALVVTIVVLLILAGITITYVMGDNSIFNKASNAKLNTELAKIEEQASLIYADKLLEKAQTNFNNKPTMQEIVGELRDKGYTIEQIAVSDNKVTGISLNKESMTLGYEKINTIQVTLEGNSSPYVYYVLVDGKYYKMNYNNGLITIARTPSDISNTEEGNTSTLTVNSGDETIATATVDNTTNVITVTAKNTAGTVAITVSYGNYTKECKVRVVEAIATELEINSVRARIATGYTRWLTAAAKPETASQEFEWTSSNPEIATVDDTGLVKAGTKGGDVTITATTKDGTNLSAKCSITTELFSEIKTSTTSYTDNEGNTAKIPRWFCCRNK